MKCHLQKLLQLKKLFRKLKKSKLRVGEILYKKARNHVKDNSKLLQEKLFKNIEKPKEIWKIIKKIRFTRQKDSRNNHIPQHEKKGRIFLL